MGRIAWHHLWRWVAASWPVMDYDFTVRHRPGVTHQNADVLSRFPRVDATDVTGARLDDDHLTAGAVLTSAEQGGKG